MQQTAALNLRQAIARTEAATRQRVRVGRHPDEADEVLGAFATDGALGFDPFPLLRALHEVGSRAVVIGQVAGIMHGSVELTGDLDLLWDGTPHEARALRDALTRSGCTELPDLELAQAGYQVAGATGDLCTPALRWGAMDVTTCLTRAEATYDPGGFVIRHVAIEDLIRMRRALGRPKDRRREAELVQLRDAGPGSS